MGRMKHGIYDSDVRNFVNAFCTVFCGMKEPECIGICEMHYVDLDHMNDFRIGDLLVNTKAERNERIDIHNNNSSAGVRFGSDRDVHSRNKDRV